MGSILLAAVPSKSSKNISRIPNPFPLPRHAMSTLTPSKCSPIYQKEEKKIKEMGENLFPFFFGGGFSARLSKQWVRDHSRAGYRWRQSKCGVKARCVCDLMHPRFIQKIAWCWCWWRGGIEPKSWTREKLVPNPCVWISPHKKENATLFFLSAAARPRPRTISVPIP